MHDQIDGRRAGLLIDHARRAVAAVEALRQSVVASRSRREADQVGAPRDHGIGGARLSVDFRQQVRPLAALQPERRRGLAGEDFRHRVESRDLQNLSALGARGPRQNLSRAIRAQLGVPREADPGGVGGVRGLHEDRFARAAGQGGGSCRNDRSGALSHAVVPR